MATSSFIIIILQNLHHFCLSHKQSSQSLALSTYLIAVPFCSDIILCSLNLILLFSGLISVCYLKSCVLSIRRCLQDSEFLFSAILTPLPFRGGTVIVYFYSFSCFRFVLLCLIWQWRLLDPAQGRLWAIVHHLQNLFIPRRHSSRIRWASILLCIFPLRTYIYGIIIMYIQCIHWVFRSETAFLSS